MKNFTLTLALIFLFAAAKISAQTSCNNTLTATISGVVNSSTCTTPCNGQATGNCSTATGYLWSNGQNAATATGLCAGTYTVYVYDAAFNCGSATVTITCPNAVNEIDGSASVEIFPNPASNNISIALSHPNGGNVSEVSVFNSIGEKVLSENYSSSKKFNHSIYVGNLPAGTYFMYMKDEKNTYRTKFVKQ